MTDDLDALVARMSKLADDMEKHATYDWDEHEDVRETLNSITTLRAQLAEAQAEVFDFPDRKAMSRRIREQRKLIRKLQVESDTCMRLLMDANARADRAEAERASQIEVDAGIAEGAWLDGVPVAEISAAIRAQPHDRTALDRMLAKARAQALREAAGLCRDNEAGMQFHGNAGWALSNRQEGAGTHPGDAYADAILAMIEGGK